MRRVVCTLSDITDRKRLEETLLQSQKLEAIGRLAGGIAHDFNNLLTVIMGYVEDIAASFPAESREHGKLTIALEASQRAAALHAGVVEGEYVMLAVSDAGSGIPREHQSHTFEPFFTTRSPDRGAGLGLATVHGIVRQHGGHIWLYSEPSRGTALKIYLPRAKSEDASEAPARNRRLSEPRGGEILLLVEDESIVRTYALKVLERGGYRVLCAADPVRALELSDEHSGVIQPLVTDAIMPHMNGRQLADELVARRPELKVLFVSGYTENSIAHHGVLDADIAFLPKPYTPTDLLDRVRQLLGS